MSDIPITKQLFEALKKRNYGASRSKGLENPLIGQFEAMRQTAMWTGEIFQPQLESLKRTAMLLLDGPVIIKIDQDKLEIEFSGKKGLKPQTQLEALVRTVLGNGWKVSITDEPGTPEAPADESGSNPKPKRTRRPKKGDRNSK